jgi:hypothetical protein
MTLEGCSYLSLLLFSFKFSSIERVSQEHNFYSNNQMREGRQ